MNNSASRIKALRLCGQALALLLCALILAGCGAKSWRNGGVAGSKSYTVRGKTYYPLKSAHGFVEEGVASWYGPGFHGKPTANGERYNQYAMTAAHKLLPLGTKVKVTHLASGKSVLVRVNDRGPFVDDRVIDLSHAAASNLGIIGPGTARVRIQSVGASPALFASEPGSKQEESLIRGDFYVQVGAFANQENARKLLEILKQAGYKGRIDFAANQLWNVQAGPWPDSLAAQKMLAGFKALYPHAFVVGAP